MATEPTIEGLKEILEDLNLKILVQELESNPLSFEDWKKRTEAQWKEELIAIKGNASGFKCERLYGEAGIDVYNYLHPNIQDTGLLINGHEEKETVKEYIKGLGLSEEVICPLLNQLQNGRHALDAWKEMKEAQWKEVAGVLAGPQIYNYLHPNRQDTGVLIKGHEMDVGQFLEIRTSRPPSKKSSLLNFVPFPPKSNAVHKGLPDATQKPVILRSALVKRISEIMERQMSLLITSPSFTGKTALANLMYNHWQQNGKNVHYISFARYESGQDLDEYFKKRLGQCIDDVMLSTGYLIMDETQNIYSHPNFWGALKSGEQVAKVLAFGVFGLSTAKYDDRSPSQFQQKWYYDNVKFTDKECMELVEAFKQYQPIAREILIPDILGDLFQFLNNHPGLVYLALHTLCCEFTRSPYNARGIADIRPLIAKGNLLFELFKAQCFVMKYEKIVQMLGAETDKVMQVLVMNDSIPLDDSLLDIHRSGICIADRTERTLRFSSEIMRVFYRDLYYKAIYGVGGSNVITSWKNETVLTLLKRILKLFNPQVFTNTQSMGRDGQRYERIYQDEFYRCCYLLAPSKCHPDVGAIYGSRGFLDFYLDGELQWGFELLHNGEKLQGHIDRFDLVSGRYADIPLADYAVVDFYETEKGVDVCDGHYYKVVFSQDFKMIQLSHNGVVEEINCGRTQ